MFKVGNKVKLIKLIYPSCILQKYVGKSGKIVEEIISGYGEFFKIEIDHKIFSVYPEELQLINSHFICLK